MLLVVRTQNRLAETLAAFPQATGLAIAATTPKVILLPAVQGVIITSQAALAALPKTDLPLYCVGPQTTKMAKKLGFQVALAGTGSAEDLAAQLLTYLEQPTTLCHVHGDYADLAWHQLLLEGGHHLTPLLGYTTHYCDSLPADIMKSFQQNRFTHIALFSAQAAKHLLLLLTRANINPHMLTAYCLSPQVATAAAPFGNTYVAANPTLASLQDLIGEHTHG